MPLTSPQRDRLFDYMMRSFAGTDFLVIIRALFNTLFLSAADQKTWLLARITTIKSRTQTLRNTVDAEAATNKTSLDAEIADLTTLEVNL